MTIVNYDGSITTDPRQLIYPQTVEEIQAVLRDTARYPAPVLRATTVASGLWNFFSGGMLDAVYVVYLVRDLGCRRHRSRRSLPLWAPPGLQAPFSAAASCAESVSGPG